MKSSTILFVIILSNFLGGCHYRILSSSWPNYGQFLPPILSEQTYKIYQRPTPFDYVERLYLGEDSTFVQIVAGQLNLEPIKGLYNIKLGKLILYPNNHDRNQVTSVYFDQVVPRDSIALTASSTWGYKIPIETVILKFPDTTVYENILFADDTLRLPFPHNFDTIRIYSTYSDNSPVDLTSNMFKNNNHVSIYFGMGHPDRCRIRDKETWRFSLNKKRLKHQKLSLFRKSHPYYYIGEIEIKN